MSRWWIAPAAVALLCTTAPAQADPTDPFFDDPPKNPDTPGAGLIIGGSFTFAACYATEVLLAISDEDARAGFVPIVGPFVHAAMAEQNGLFDIPEIERAAAIVLGFGQLAGAAMVVTGVAMATVETSTGRIELTPTVGPGTAGLTGRF